MNMERLGRLVMQDLRERRRLFQAGEPIVECAKCKAAMLRHGECPQCGWILPNRARRD